MTEKYPDAGKQYIDYAKTEIGKCELNKAYEKFTNALEASYASAPEANKLDSLFKASDEYLELDKDPHTSSQWHNRPGRATGSDLGCL
jgi:hypothetical protein